MKTSNKILSIFFPLVFLTGIGAMIALKANLVPYDKSKDDFNITYQMGEIIGIESNDNFHYIIESSSNPYVKVSGLRGIVDSIVVDKEDDILKLGLRGNAKGQVKVYVGMNDLQVLNLSGKSQLTLENQMDIENLVISQNGESSLDLNIKTDSLEISLNGKSTANISGKTEFLNAKTNGNTQLVSPHLHAQKVEVLIGGQSRALVHPVEKISGAIKGSGVLDIDGEPNEINVDGI